MSNCKWCDEGSTPEHHECWDFYYHAHLFSNPHLFNLCRNKLPSDVEVKEVKQKEPLEDIEMEGHLPFLLSDILDELNTYYKNHPGQIGPCLRIFGDGSGSIKWDKKVLATFSFYKSTTDKKRLEIIKGINK